MKTRMQRAASGMGFSAAQYQVMYELASAESISMHELVDRCGLPKSTLSRVVDQLVKRGVVKSTRPEDNRRVVILTVTDSYVKEKQKLKQTVVEDISGRIPRGKTAAIKKNLEELYEIIRMKT
jgi:DNA-binding MarR family transcriptional regulator